MAVMFAMICSFILSRTLVPTMANYLLKPHVVHAEGHERPRSRNPLVRFQRGFEVQFEKFRAVYHDLLGLALSQPAGVHRLLHGLRAGVVRAGAVPRPQLLPDRRLRPDPDARARARSARASRRAPTTSPTIQKAIRSIIPPNEIATMVDNVGMPVSGINMTYNNTGTIGPQDGDIQIKLTPGPQADRRTTWRELRRRAARAVSRASPSPSCRPTSSARS